MSRNYNSVAMQPDYNSSESELSNPFVSNHFTNGGISGNTNVFIFGFGRRFSGKLVFFGGEDCRCICNSHALRLRNTAVLRTERNEANKDAKLTKKYCMLTVSSINLYIRFHFEDYAKFKIL